MKLESVNQSKEQPATKPAHTPTPWINLPAWTGSNVYPIGCEREPGVFDIVAEVTGNGGTPEQDVANAALIVRACNAWNDSAALKARISELEGHSHA